MESLKIIHTSDWHLGHRFYDQSRHDEQRAFLNWLLKYIEENPVDALLISGDIYDTATPPNLSQELYHQFLLKASNTGLSQIIVTGGNHDSPSQLHTTRDILKHFKITVVGKIDSKLEDQSQLFVDIKDKQGKIKGRVLAVPYLREKDFIKYKSNESDDENRQRFAESLKEFYFNLAQSAREDLASDIPLIAMGHLYVTGAKTSESEREIHIGSRGNISSNIFPEEMDYLALGHIHNPQVIGDDPRIQYSGSPLPMNFSERGQTKGINLVSWENQELKIEKISVPQTVNLVIFSGTLDEIEQKIKDYQPENEKQKSYAEVKITLESPRPEVFELIKGWCGKKVTPLKVVPVYLGNNSSDEELVELDQLTPNQILKSLYERKYSTELPTDIEESFMELLKEVEEQR